MKSPLHPLDADVPVRGVRVHASLPGKERKSRVAGLVSFLLHAVIIYLAIRLTATVAMPEHSPIGDVIKMVLGGGGGGGGQGGTAFEHAPPPPPVTPPVHPSSVPIPAVTPPPVVPQTVPPPAVAAPAPSAATPTPTAGTGNGTVVGAGTGEGPGKGSGQGPGSGSGSGAGDGPGTGGFPPQNRQMIVPPIDGVPKELRGQMVEVTFFVTATGHVSNVKVSPPIANHSFAQKFDEVMRGYGFTAGRDAAGNKVAGIAIIQIPFGNK